VDLVNRGIAALRKALEECGGNQSQLARDLDVDQSYLSRLAREERTPGLEFRRKAKERLGIGLDAWEEEEPAPDTELAHG